MYVVLDEGYLYFTDLNSFILVSDGITIRQDSTVTRGVYDSPQECLVPLELQVLRRSPYHIANAVVSVNAFHEVA